LPEAEPSFLFWIRRLDVGDWPYALRFEVTEGKGVLRVARPGVVIDPPARARGFEDSLAGEQLRASRFLHVWDGGRKRQGYVLSKLDDEQLERLDVDVWHELEVSRDGGFRYLRLARNDTVIGLSGLEHSGGITTGAMPAPPLAGLGPSGPAFAPPNKVARTTGADASDDPVTESGVPLPMFEDDDSRLVGIDERPDPIEGPGGGFHSDPVVDGRLQLPDDVVGQGYSPTLESEDTLLAPGVEGASFGGDTELNLEFDLDEEDVLDAPSAEASLLLDHHDIDDNPQDAPGGRLDDVTVVKMGGRGPADIGAALRHVSARNRRDVMPVEIYSGVDPNALVEAPRPAFDEQPTFLALDDDELPPVRVAEPLNPLKPVPRVGADETNATAEAAPERAKPAMPEPVSIREEAPPTWLIRGLRRRLEVNEMEMLDLRARVAELEAELVEARASGSTPEQAPPPVRGRRRNAQS
jgi:hypothetical protein